MSNEADETPDVAAAPGFRVEGLPAPVDPSTWATSADADPVPGSITAGDLFTAGEVQQG